MWNTGQPGSDGLTRIRPAGIRLDPPDPGSPPQVELLGADAARQVRRAELAQRNPARATLSLRVVAAGREAAAGRQGEQARDDPLDRLQARPGGRAEPGH